MIFRIIIMVCLISAATVVTANPEGVYKYRQGVMKAVGGQMAALGASLKGQVFTENIRLHAGAMADLVEIVPHVFPAGSGTKKSEALPAIWEQPEEFESRLNDFVNAAKSLAKITASDDMKAIGGGVQKLGKTCKGCHDDFREEQEH